jgi:hypothetical protein
MLLNHTAQYSIYFNQTLARLFSLSLSLSLQIAVQRCTYLLDFDQCPSRMTCRLYRVQHEPPPSPLFLVPSSFFLCSRNASAHLCGPRNIYGLMEEKEKIKVPKTLFVVLSTKRNVEIRYQYNNKKIEGK